MSRPRCFELLLPPEPLPPRLRAAGARSSVAWGGFLATRRPNAPSYPHFRSPNPPHPRRGPGQDHSSPPLASFASPECTPERDSCPGSGRRHAWAAHWGQENQGTKLPPRETRLLRPRGTSPPELSVGRALHFGSSRELRCLALCPPTPAGASRALGGRLPWLLAPQASSLANQDAVVSTLPAAQLTRLQSYNQLKLASLPTCGRSSSWLMRHRLFSPSASPTSPPTDAASPTECTLGWFFPQLRALFGFDCVWLFAKLIYAAEAPSAGERQKLFSLSQSGLRSLCWRRRLGPLAVRGAASRGALGTHKIAELGGPPGPWDAELWPGRRTCNVCSEPRGPPAGPAGNVLATLGTSRRGARARIRLAARRRARCGAGCFALCAARPWFFLLPH